MTMALAIFCKSFAEDFDRLQLLLDSAARFADGYTFVLSIPRVDRAALAARCTLHDAVTVVFDEDYCTVAQVGSQGWVQQQYCKMSVHRLGLADVYLCIDSDSYFISELRDVDFLDGAVPRYVYSNIFTKFLPGNAGLPAYLLSDGAGHRAPQPGVRYDFADQLARFQSWIGTAEDQGAGGRAFWLNRMFGVPANAALQPGQIITATVLAEFETFLQVFGLSIAWALREVPWEYNWYGCWASTYPRTVACPSVSPIIHFASDQDVLLVRQAGVTLDVMARKFRVVQMAARHFDRVWF